MNNVIAWMEKKEFSRRNTFALRLAIHFRQGLFNTLFDKLPKGTLASSEIAFILSSPSREIHDN
jgi:hypothetical protein